jgi:hypothetical protein
MKNLFDRVPRAVVVTAVFCAAAAGLAGAAAAFGGSESPASRPAGQVVEDQRVQQEDTGTGTSAVTTPAPTTAEQPSQVGGQPGVQQQAGQPIAPAAEPEPTTTAAPAPTTTTEQAGPEQPPSQVPSPPTYPVYCLSPEDPTPGCVPRP